MSPIYEEAGRLTREELYELRRYNKCKECGGMLNVFMDYDAGKAFLACNDWPRSHHEGIEKEASQWQQKGLESLNIPTRRKMMKNELGAEKTKALDKYMGVVSLTKPQAREILVAVFPEAPDQEIARAVMLCASYGLNPLMKHVFLIPFNKGKPNESWATVIGIKAKRLLASRRGSYSYVDNTPRIMTEEEQRRTFGEVYSDKIMVITKVKDPATGAEAPGYGAWPKDSEPYGTEKGNSKFNMAAIRSESQALDRLRPGEMPVGIEVAPEEFIEGEFKEVETEPAPKPEPKEHWCEEHNCRFEKKTRGTSTWYAHKLPGGTWCNEAKKQANASNQVPKATPYIPESIGDLPSDEPEPVEDEPLPEELEQPATLAEAIPSQPPPEIQALDFDPDWLFDSLRRLKWTDTTVKSYCLNVYKVNSDGEPLDAKLELVDFVASLKRQDREALIKEVQDRLQML